MYFPPQWPESQSFFFGGGGVGSHLVQMELARGPLEAFDADARDRGLRIQVLRVPIPRVCRVCVLCLCAVTVRCDCVL